MKRICQLIPGLKQITPMEYWSLLNSLTKNYTTQQFEEEFGVGAIQSLRLFKKFGIVRVGVGVYHEYYAAFFATPSAIKKIKQLDLHSSS